MIKHFEGFRQSYFIKGLFLKDSSDLDIVISYEGLRVRKNKDSYTLYFKESVPNRVRKTLTINPRDFGSSNEEFEALLNGGQGGGGASVSNVDVVPMLFGTNIFLEQTILLGQTIIANLTLNDVSEYARAEFIVQQNIGGGDSVMYTFVQPTTAFQFLGGIGRFSFPVALSNTYQVEIEAIDSQADIIEPRIVLYK